MTRSDRIARLRTELEGLTTERAAAEFADLDVLPTRDVVRVMLDDGRQVADAVLARADEIARAVDLVADRMSRGGRLLYLGAGTPGRLGVLDASEIPPTFGVDPSRVVGIIAGGPSALVSSIEGAEDDAALGAADLEAAHLGPDDVVVGITASGRTPYVVGGLAHARTVGAGTVAVACNVGTPVAALADVGIEVVVGPEVVAGSTRLKAGTAQKLVLNAISTVTMIRLGKTYAGHMVDLQTSNEKLRARGERTVMLITGVDEDTARDALRATDGAVKAAILVSMKDLTGRQALDLLAAHGGRLRDALEATA
ncbi:N-acetylmuramic acid 6-phosphate etherase [Luteimicrobium xylanilyticum]|uniref:N-acetylmuramic acid 6-phosphate etherase n=1 Tax=Luteimicrobium xylanilyticum TaxID=1133546 RepID=A0A5P9QEF2_9MICO|nr:N-acetylmuramic acid 6-phosphate etherase [Luteimicrobium xylanilyticum]QFU99482.1 N-acetylmuramic acid 6-phosphate etherase [Luteimicrobium xylanilyticum]